jgi:hypothetical protein
MGKRAQLPNFWANRTIWKRKEYRVANELQRVRKPRRNFLHIARGRKAHPGILWGGCVPEGSKAPICVGNITIGNARSPAGLRA